MQREKLRKAPVIKGGGLHFLNYENPNAYHYGSEHILPAFEKAAK